MDWSRLVGWKGLLIALVGLIALMMLVALLAGGWFFIGSGGTGILQQIGPFDTRERCEESREWADKIARERGSHVSPRCYRLK